VPASSAGTTHPTGRQSAFLPQLALALRNGVTVQTRDACQLLDAATPDLRGEQTRKQPAHPFVGHSEQAVDRPMLACDRTTRLLPADRTPTGVHESNIRSNHGTYLLAF